MSKHWQSNHSQVYWTCLALCQGRIITHMDEIGEVNGWRLGAIVHNLRHKYSWPIATDYKGPERIAHYSLTKGADWRALDFPRSAKGVRNVLRAVQDGAYGSDDG